MNNQLLELLVRCGAQSGCDRAPCYAVMETSPQAAMAVLKGVSSLYSVGIADTVMLCGEAGGNGYEGGAEWVSKLRELDVPDDEIHSFVGARMNGSSRAADFNTLTEMQSLVRELWKLHHEEIILVAPAFHLPRVMTSFVTALRTEKVPFISAWGYAATVGSWGTEVAHSQGVQTGSITDIFVAECSKIDGPRRYENLLPLNDVIAYLDERDYKVL